MKPKDVSVTFKGFQRDQRKSDHLERLSQQHRIKRRRSLLVALGLHHAELEAYTLNDTKVSRPPSLPYVSEKDQRVQSAQFKASVLI